MATLLTPGVLRVGVWDHFWRKLGCDPDPSITYFQPDPSPYGFEWIDACEDPSRVDVVMASWGMGRLVRRSRHTRRILYLQETSEGFKPPPVDDLKPFDLILSNDQTVLDALPEKSRYMTLFGIRMRPDEYAAVPPKCRNISLMGSLRRQLTGNALRWRVHDTLRGFDSFGFNGVTYRKAESLAEYRFQICVENARYRHWATEKLWDAFALETVPIYWGGITDDVLASWGFRVDGILRWTGDLDELEAIVDRINASPEDSYARFADAVAHNRRRVLEIPCGEVGLKRVICEYFHLV